MSALPDAWQPGDREPDVQVTLPVSVALRLQAALLRALAEREGQTTRQRDRRHEAHALLEQVRDALNKVLPASEARSEINTPQ
jgi:hypothetical protein